MIDPNADPDQLDLEDLLASRQGSFAFWSTCQSATIEMQVTPEEETDINQLPLPLFDLGKRDARCSAAIYKHAISLIAMPLETRTSFKTVIRVV